MSFIVIGTTGLAALAAMLFAYRRSEANLRELGAFSAARAIAEQISTLDYETLGGSTLPVDIPSSAVGTLATNSWDNVRREDIHSTPDRVDDDLVINFRPEVTQSDDTTLFGCTQVVLRFRWQENAFFASRTREDSLTLVVAKVNSY